MSNNTDMQSLTLLLKKFITNKNTHYGPYLRKFQKELSILSSKLDKSMEEFQDTSIQTKIKAIINFPPFEDVKSLLALCDSLLMEINRYNKINYDDGELFGIFIGINNYNGKKNLSLQFACNDAIELAEFFFGKIEKRSIYLLIDRTEVTNELITSAIIKTFEPTRSQIIDKVNFVRMNAKEQDKIIFFFAGHGNYYSNNEYYLIPQDCTPLDFKTSGLKLGYIIKTLLKSNASNIIVLLDACRNETSNIRSLDMNFGTFRFDNNNSKKNLKILYSASREQLSKELFELNHGIFTYYLLEALKGKICNEKGEIWFDDLVKYVEKKVKEKSKGEQIPDILTIHNLNNDNIKLFNC